MIGNLGQLPKEPADLFTKPLTRFLRIGAMAGAILLVCTIIALVLSNTAWSTQFHGFWETKAGFSVGGMEFARSLKHWINDGLMTLFFFVVALELTGAEQRPIFGHGQRRDVANAALIEIAGRRMVGRMRTAPAVVGCQREDAERAAGPVIHRAVGEKGTVAAIVLDHEQAKQEARGRDSQTTPHQKPFWIAIAASIQRLTNGTSVTASSNRLRPL